MGITMLTLTDDILRELRQRSSTVPHDITQGVLVWKVIIGSPANMYAKRMNVCRLSDFSKNILNILLAVDWHRETL